MLTQKGRAEKQLFALSLSLFFSFSLGHKNTNVHNSYFESPGYCFFFAWGKTYNGAFHGMF
jgi:hypothetical protein